MIYDIYSEQEKEIDPEKRNTGLLFFRGNNEKSRCPGSLQSVPYSSHGFGIGIGTEAEGWMDDAVSFWEQHMKEKNHVQRGRRQI